MGISLLGVSSAQAYPNRWIVGAALGTAAGLVIAHNVHGVNPWIAAPVGALVGASIASGHDRDRHNNRVVVHDRGYYDGYRGGYRGRGYAYRDSWCYAPPRTQVVYVHDAVVDTPAPAPAVRAAAPQPQDPQPGVDLIKVSILNSNGIRTDVPILRVNGKFVGPQGEQYETLPSNEVLTQRYGM